MKVSLLILLIGCALAWNSFAPGEGPFSHMTPQEFADAYLMKGDEGPTIENPKFDKEEFLKAVGGVENYDMSHSPDMDCVSKIRDQGKCGSCWAFALTGHLTDRHCLRYNESRITYAWFSPQYLINCVTPEHGAHACEGADTQKVFSWLEANENMMEKCYPYHSGTDQEVGVCDSNSCTHPAYMVKFYVEKGSTILFNNYEYAAMAKDIIENGPIFMAMQVYSDFINYKGGVYHKTVSSPSLGGHAIRVVGWGHDEETDDWYWIAANSWGTTWGEEGFFRIGFNEEIGYKGGSAISTFEKQNSISNLLKA